MTTVENYQRNVGARFQTNLELWREYSQTRPDTLREDWAADEPNNKIKNFVKSFGGMTTGNVEDNPNNVFQFNVHAAMANRVAKQYEAEGNTEAAKDYYKIAENLFKKTRAVSKAGNIGAEIAANSQKRLNLEKAGKLMGLVGIGYGLLRVVGKIAKPFIYLALAIAAVAAAALGIAAIGTYFFAGSFAVGPTALINAATANAGLISGIPVAAAAVGHFFASGMMVPAAMTAISGMPLGLGILASAGLGLGIGLALVGAFFLLKAAWNGFKSSASVVAEGWKNGPAGVNAECNDNFFSQSKNLDVTDHLESETGVLFKAQKEAMTKYAPASTASVTEEVRNSISDIAAAARHSTSLGSSAVSSASSVEMTDSALSASHDASLRSRVAHSISRSDVESATHEEKERLVS